MSTTLEPATPRLAAPVAISSSGLGNSGDGYRLRGNENKKRYISDLD